MGEGTRIRFWHDRWIGDTTLKDLLAASYSLLQLIQTCIPQGTRRDTLFWRLKGDGKFDTRSYYLAIRGASNSLFPWKGVWKPKIPKRVALCSKP